MLGELMGRKVHVMHTRVSNAQQPQMPPKAGAKIQTPHKHLLNYGWEALLELNGARTACPRRSASCSAVAPTRSTRINRCYARLGRY